MDNLSLSVKEEKARLAIGRDLHANTIFSPRICP